MKITCAKGTPAQLLDAVEDRIAELSATSTPVQSSTAIDLLDTMTLGEQINWLYQTHGADDIDYPEFEDEMYEQYNIEVAQTGYEGSFDQYIREICEDEIDQGFELTPEMLEYRNEYRDDVTIESTEAITGTESVETMMEVLYSRWDDGSLSFDEFKYALDDMYNVDVSKGTYEGSFDQWVKDTYQQEILSTADVNECSNIVTL